MLLTSLGEELPLLRAGSLFQYLAYGVPLCFLFVNPPALFGQDLSHHTLISLNSRVVLEGHVKEQEKIFKVGFLLILIAVGFGCHLLAEH